MNTACALGVAVQSKRFSAKPSARCAFGRHADTSQLRQIAWDGSMKGIGEKRGGTGAARERLKRLMLSR